jgi:hypothetical protein
VAVRDRGPTIRGNIDYATRSLSDYAPCIDSQ